MGGGSRYGEVGVGELRSQAFTAGAALATYRGVVYVEVW